MEVLVPMKKKEKVCYSQNKIQLGDLHGDLVKARDALQMVGVLSSDGRDQWISQDTVLVEVGDILDRGDDEIAILSLLRSLDAQAKANGGAVFQIFDGEPAMIRRAGAETKVDGSPLMTISFRDTTLELEVLNKEEDVVFFL